MTYNDRLSIGEEIRQAKYNQWVEKVSSRVNILGNKVEADPARDLILEMLADGELKNQIEWLRYQILIVTERERKYVNLRFDYQEEPVGMYPLSRMNIQLIPLPDINHNTLRAIDSLYSELRSTKVQKVHAKVLKLAPGVFSWLLYPGNEQGLPEPIWELIEESLKLIWEGYE